MNSRLITGFASTKSPTAQGIEITMVVFTASPIFSLAPFASRAAISCATEGIMAEAMAEAKAMGILDIVRDCPEKIPYFS